jgi:hypothetical protein
MLESLRHKPVNCLRDGRRQPAPRPARSPPPVGGPPRGRDHDENEAVPLPSVGADFEQKRAPATGRIFYLAAVIPLSLGVYAIFLLNPGMDWYERARMREMIYGTAHQPFVQRALLPLVVRGAAACLPPEALNGINQALAQDPAIDNLFKILGFDRDHALEYLFALALMYLSLWGFVWSLRYLFTGVYRAPPRVLDGFILVALVGLTQFFRSCNYLYDFSNIFLFTLGLALQVRRCWGPYLFVYALACLNKETTILLALVFALNYWNDATLTRTGFRALLLAQLAISGLVKAALLLVFRDNPGAPVEWHATDHNFGILAAYPAAALFGWCGLILLLFYRWTSKPRFPRRALWVVPPLVASAFFFGHPDELRDYYEAYPIVALLLLHGVSRLCQFELVNRDAAACTAHEPPT